jgi:high-affinity nickel-transport protein
MLLAGTVLLYGIRHGIDWDHLAAITDVTGAQRTPRRGIAVATAYAAGHGAVVFVLGCFAVLGHDLLPAAVDSVMERVVGTTLLALAVAVVFGLVRDRRTFRLRSRWMFVMAGVAHARRWMRERALEVWHDHPHAPDESHGHTHVGMHEGFESRGETRATTTVGHRHAHRHVVAVGDGAGDGPGVRVATGIGMLHGVGAETPTQVVVILTAAGVGGRASGVLLLGCFIAGIFVSNTVVALAASYGYLNATRHFRVYVAIALANAAASSVVGVVLLAGGHLPALAGG